MENKFARKDKIKISLLTKIFSFTILPTLVAFVCIYSMVIVTAKSAVTSVTDNLLQSKAQQVSNQVDGYFSRYEAEVSAMRLNPNVEQLFAEWAAGNTDSGSVDSSAAGTAADNTTSIATATGSYESSVNAYLTNLYKANSAALLSVWTADMKTHTLANLSSAEKGVEKTAGYDMTTRPWYDKMKASGSDVVITEPYQDVVTGKTVVSVIGAVYQSDSDKMIGVVGFDLSMDFLQKIGDQFTDGTNFLMITSQAGYILYHPDSGMQNKAMADAGMDKNLVSTVNDGKERIGQFAMKNQQSIGTAVTGETTGWKILYGTTYNQYIGAVHSMEVKILVIFTAVTVLLITLVFVFGRKIVKPITGFAHTANRMADGEVDLEIITKTNDEVGLLSHALSRIVDRLKEYMRYIDEICNALDLIAEGDLTFELHCEYFGEFARIKNSLLNIQNSLVGTISDISDSSRSVSNQAEQIAASSQTLAQGATEQASAISELTATIDEISVEVSHTANKAMAAKAKANETSSMISQSDHQMKELQTAMNNISDASNQISKIISTIDSIAFQTNILALNAAVEAARAGSSGKGFAVVADEVRNLANKSAEATRNTEVLIQQALAAVSRGGEMTKMVGVALGEVVKSTNEVVLSVDDISAASNQQAEAVSQVVLGIGQISSVVESNSAAAEESAATGTEMAEQAENLNHLVQRFKLH